MLPALFLSLGTSADDLRQYFGQFATVEYAEIPLRTRPDGSKRPRHKARVAFVRFKDLMFHTLRFLLRFVPYTICSVYMECSLGYYVGNARLGSR